ncbi:unnamed protein product, partial [Onchocerca flexuosa]|uniref:GOLD domain-containing protein n=1 Tax=Onchocerca flexuosa TaxID=387005 RepID=A0A183HXG5_9BILA
KAAKSRIKTNEIHCQPAVQEQYAELKSLESPSNLETITISPGKQHLIYVDVKDKGNKLQWYFTTDGDINFGVFYEPPHQILLSNEAISDIRQEKEINIDELEMVYPWLKLAAKLVSEADSIECTRPGRYWIIICNKLSWIRRKTVNLVIQLVCKDNAKRCCSNGTFGNCSKPFAINYLL